MTDKEEKDHKGEFEVQARPIMVQVGTQSPNSPRVLSFRDRQAIRARERFTRNQAGYY